MIYIDREKKLFGAGTVDLAARLFLGPPAAKKTSNRLIMKRLNRYDNDGDSL